VWNLLSNAIKFTPNGGRVEVEVIPGTNQAEIHVRDTGQGIAPGFLPLVFEPFRQADGSPARRSGGLGLGLAIVRHLVEMHGGAVEARSAGEGEGSTFVVRLPLLTFDADLIRGGAAEPVRAMPEDGIAGVRILLVEDEPDTRESLRVILGQAGGDVVAVGTTAEALRTLGSWQPHLLLCDLGLPGEDGYALIRKVRALPDERKGQVPAVALTAYAQTSDRIRALRAGFQAHVAKPFEPERLLGILARTLHQSAPKPEPAAVAGAADAAEPRAAYAPPLAGSGRSLRSLP
jgi:CheY-like chemotaxis protein